MTIFKNIIKVTKTKMKKLLLLLALIATATFTACEDDDTTTGPSTGSTYQPTNINSWWAADEFETDSLGNIIQDTYASSTMTAGTSFQLNGKTATNFINTSADGGKDTTILAVEGTVVYMDGKAYENIGDMSNIFGEESPEIDLNLTWVKIADSKASNWEIAKVPIVDMDVSSMANGMPAKMNGNTTVTGYKKGTAIVNIKGTNYTAQEFNIESKMTGKVTAMNIEAATVSYTNTQRLWFVENVGLVKTEIAPTVFEIKYSALAKQFSTELEDMKMVSGGLGSLVKDYKIVK